MARSSLTFAAGRVCIRRFARTFDGLVEGSGAISYKCRGHVTQRMTTSVTFRISAVAECDDVGALIPSSGLRLQAKGTTVHRADGVAHFVGRGQIVNTTPEPDVVLFKGNLELVARIGSHPALGEACAPEQHVEGWFVGVGQRRFAKMTLHVVLAGGGDLAAGTNAFPDASQNRMIGTLVVAP
jgi:hypothetical protein